MAILEPALYSSWQTLPPSPVSSGLSLGMPDIHWGYGFPIGGVAAFSLDEGVISPGGVGFDINCGVRLFTTPLTQGDIKKPREFIESLYQAVPTGVGAKGSVKVSPAALTAMMEKGARWAVDSGYGVERDLPVRGWGMHEAGRHPCGIGKGPCPGNPAGGDPRLRQPFP